MSRATDTRKVKEKKVSRVDTSASRAKKILIHKN